MQVSIDNHTMTVISTDSSEVEPVTVDSVFLAIGERVNVLVTADQPSGKALHIVHISALNIIYIYDISALYVTVTWVIYLSRMREM